MLSSILLLTYSLVVNLSIIPLFPFDSFSRNEIRLHCHLDTIDHSWSLKFHRYRTVMSSLPESALLQIGPCCEAFRKAAYAVASVHGDGELEGDGVHTMLIPLFTHWRAMLANFPYPATSETGEISPVPQSLRDYLRVNASPHLFDLMIKVECLPSWTFPLEEAVQSVALSKAPIDSMFSLLEQICDSPFNPTSSHLVLSLIVRIPNAKNTARAVLLQYISQVGLSVSEDNFSEFCEVLGSVDSICTFVNGADTLKHSDLVLQFAFEHILGLPSHRSTAEQLSQIELSPFDDRFCKEIHALPVGFMHRNEYSWLMFALFQEAVSGPESAYAALKMALQQVVDDPVHDHFPQQVVWIELFKLCVRTRDTRRISNDLHVYFQSVQSHLRALSLGGSNREGSVRTSRWSTLFLPDAIGSIPFVGGHKGLGSQLLSFVDALTHLVSCVYDDPRQQLHLLESASGSLKKEPMFALL